VKSLVLTVTKADGSRQLFDRAKIVKTCLRMGASPLLASQVAEKIANRAYEAMSTKEILQMIFRFMRKDKPGVKHLFDLRKGLSLMFSKPEFEMFVRVLLTHNGFEVKPNAILKGRCGEHEVDAIARKGGVTYFVEAKHHLNYHALTGLDETRIARAVLEDVSEGFQNGNNNLRIDKAMIVTNTRYSDHALNYGMCRGIVQVGWNWPANRGIEKMVQAGNLHPLSCLRGLRNEDRQKLVDIGMVLIRDLTDEDPKSLATRTGISLEAVEEILENAQHSANTLEYY